MLSHKNTLPEVIEEMNWLVTIINEKLKDLAEKLGGDRNNCYLIIEPKKVYRYFLMYLKRDATGASKKNYWGRIFWNEGREVERG
jgi:hypothetical protein